MDPEVQFASVRHCLFAMVFKVSFNNKTTVSLMAWMHGEDFEIESHHGKASSY